MSQDPDTQATRESSAAQVAAEARAAELREELAITEQRRAEEAEAKAEAEIAAAQKAEAKREKERREAEARRQQAAAEAERARARAAQAEPAPQPAPAPAAAAVEGPERPELYVAGAFVGAFLFARILKKIAD